MASLNPDQEEQQNNQQPAPGAPQTIGGTAGASATSGQGGSAGNGVGGAAPQSPVAQNQAPQANTGYTDVASYLDANKGGSADLGNKVASNLTGDYNNVKSGIDSSSQSAQKLADQGYTHENSGLIQQAAANPVQTAAVDGNAAAVQAQLNSKYIGPNSWGDYGTQQGNVASAQQEGNLYSTPGGLNVLSQKAEGPTASRGVNQLDSLLLGGSADAMGAVKAASDPFATLGNYLDSQNKAVTGAIATGQAGAAQASKNANSAFDTAASSFNDEVGTGAQKAEAARQAYNGQLNQFYDQAVPIEQRINQWAGSTYGRPSVDDLISPVLKANQTIATPITASNYATADQYKRAAALQQLAGDRSLNLPISQSTAAQAGTAPTVQNGNLPALDSILQQYASPLVKAETQAMAGSKADPNNTGDTIARSTLDKYNDLITFLQSQDSKFMPQYSVQK